MMSKSQSLFLAVFVCVLSTALVFIGAAASRAGADSVAEVPSRFQLIEESKFGSNVCITIFRVRNPRRYGDVVFEYCVLTSPNAPATILYKEEIASQE